MLKCIFNTRPGRRMLKCEAEGRRQSRMHQIVTCTVVVPHKPCAFSLCGRNCAGITRPIQDYLCCGRGHEKGSKAIVWSMLSRFLFEGCIQCLLPILGI